MKTKIGKNFQMGKFCDLEAVPLKAEFRGATRVLLPANFGVEIGDNVTLGSNVEINCGVKMPTRIGDCSFIWHGSSIGHDCQIGRHTIVNVGSRICGEVTIGDYSYIAPSVVIQPYVKIGNYSMVGTFSNVIHHTVIPDGEIWFGNPAKFKKLNKWRPPE